MTLPGLLEQLPPAFTVKEAKAAGLPKRHLNNQDLRRPFHGVRSRKGCSILDRLKALMRQIPRHAFMAGPTVAALLGLPLPREIGNIRPLTEPFIAVQRGHARIRRKRTHAVQLSIIHGDIMTHDGVRITSPERTWVDLSRTMTGWDFLAVTDALIGGARPVTTLRKLHRYADLHTGTAGAKLRKQALEWADPLAESPMESIVRWHILAKEGPRPECNTTLLLPDGTHYRPDMLFRDQGYIVEYNGAHHDDPRMWKYDNRRTRALEDAGFRVTILCATDIPHLAKRAETIIHEVQNSPPSTVDPAVSFKSGQKHSM